MIASDRSSSRKIVAVTFAPNGPITDNGSRQGESRGRKHSRPSLRRHRRSDSSRCEPAQRHDGCQAAWLLRHELAGRQSLKLSGAQMIFICTECSRLWAHYKLNACRAAGHRSEKAACYSSPSRRSTTAVPWPTTSFEIVRQGSEPCAPPSDLRRIPRNFGAAISPNSVMSPLFKAAVIFACD